jgi:hypothetical protein
MAVAGSAVFFYLNPEARVKTGARLQTQMDRARAKSSATNPDLPAWDNRPSHKSDPSGTKVGTDESSARKGSEQGSEQGSERGSELGSELGLNPSTNPLADAPRTVTSSPEDQQRAREAPVRSPAHVEQPEAPKVESTPSDNLSDDAAIAQARTLWSSAIDAEGKGDYAEAVRCYEQIKRLPPVAHQAGLELRLANARHRLGQ